MLNLLKSHFYVLQRLHIVISTLHLNQNDLVIAIGENEQDWFVHNRKIRGEMLNSLAFYHC
jgi:hypothetical protein